jgi:CubicO group peptidase (beta-lactamase class C family)
MRSCATLRGAALLLAVSLSATAAHAQPAPLRGLDTYIERAMQEWKVPGLAIAVVKDDSVVYARGFGVREVGRPERVDASTIFAIGSATKPVTAAAVGVLVDEGRVRWTDPAAQHLPGLQLFDPYVTRELTVRDLLTHRSGLARGDLMWIVGEFDRADILRRVRHLEPSWSFRSQFGYQNLMYLAAGELVPAVTQTSWDDLVRERIFAPLGMRASSTSIRALEGRTDLAIPHAEIDGQVRPIAWRNIDNIGPAGSINSNVLDMAQWVRMNLNEGSYRGERVLSPEVVRTMQTPETLIRSEGAWALMAPEANFMAYGVGWFMNDYRGRKVVQHGGNIDGMHALVGMLPAEELGVVILTNLNPNFLTYALMYRIFDGYLGGPQQDWSRRHLASADTLMEMGRAQQRRMEEGRVEGTRPSRPLAEYAGTYEEAVHGRLTVAEEGGGLVLRWGPRQVADLEHWHYDTFRASWRDPGFLSIFGRSFVTFTLDPQGTPARVEIPGAAEFRRVAEPARAAGGAR